MGESRPSVDLSKVERNGVHRLGNPMFPKLLVQLPNMIQDRLKMQLQRLGKDSDRFKPVNSANGSSSDMGVDLEKQLQPWRENPSWVEQPTQIKVSVPKGSLCNLKVNVDVGLPPDAVFDIITDPDNKRVFKNIQEVISRQVLVDEGHRQVVEVDQAALWKFLWWSGTISVHVLVDQNRKDYSMKFRQVKTGFMKRFEGCWTLEPIFVDEKTCSPFKPKTLEDYYSCTGGKGRVGSKLSLDQLIQPAIVPPPPISWYLRGITSKTTEMLIKDLLAETARIRGGTGTEKSNEELGSLWGIHKHQQIDHVSNIKERWKLHRRSGRQRHRGLLNDEPAVSD